MYCSNCGAEIKGKGKFCPNCGTEVKETKKEEVAKKKTVTEPEKKVEVVTEKKGEGLGTASMIIGIISIILSIFLNVLILLIPIVGLILGIVNKANGGKKISGIVLNIISIVLSIFMFIFFLFLGVSLFSSILETGFSSNPVAGKYNCSGFSGQGPSKNYIVRLELNNDKSFLWGKYGDVSRNYVRGSYTYVDLYKKNAAGNYSYYTVNLDGDVFYQNGIKQSEPYGSTYEFGITKDHGKKQGIMMNTKTYNMYYCFEE